MCEISPVAVGNVRPMPDEIITTKPCKPDFCQPHLPAVSDHVHEDTLIHTKDHFYEIRVYSFIKHRHEYTLTHTKDHAYEIRDVFLS